MQLSGRLAFGSLLAFACVVQAGSWQERDLTTYGAESHRINISTTTTNEAFSRFIVQYADNSRAAFDMLDLEDRLVKAEHQTGLELQYVRTLATGARLISVERAIAGAEALEFMRTIAEDPEVRYIEPDARMVAYFTPNDEFYDLQWHYHEATAGMNLPTAWDTTTGTGSIVAVLDTGYTVHPDLDGNRIAGYDFISDASAARDGNGRDADAADEGDWYGFFECGFFGSANSSWHGTHVAGTVAAVTNNSSGVAGVAFGAQFQPVRVLGKCGGTLADISDAIVWASGGSVSGVPNNPTPADVINMSLGGSGSCGSTYQNAIDTAVANGLAVVVAAGNSNADVSGFRPGNCNNVISVAASDREGNRASYSNYGALIDVAAPGGETAVSGNGVASTLNSGTTTPGSPNYVYYQGTSMAAPHVAGLAALMLSVDPSLTPAQIESEIENNARALAGSCSGGCGAGLADAAATIAALGGGNPQPPAAPSGLSANAISDSEIDLSWSDNSGDETGFKIERKTGAGGSYAQIATTGANVTSFSDSGLAASTTYFYRVRATNAAGDSAYSNEDSATTQATPQPPAAPSGLAAVAASDSQIDLTWSDNSSDESNFHVERDSGGGFSEIAVLGANSTAYSDTGLAASTTYTYRVRASNGAGFSGYSNSSSATTDDPPPPPTGVKLTKGVVGGIGSSWTTVNLGQSYASMVVVATPSYTSSSGPVAIRIRNAANSSFEIRADAAGGATPSNITVHYMVVEEGVYNVGDHGVKMEAVKYTSTLTDENNSWVGEVRSYQQSYSSPVVLGQVMTYNDPNFSHFWNRGSGRNAPPNSSNLRTGKTVSEDPNTARADETVGYIVIEAGNGSMDGVSYTAALGADSIRGMSNSPPYNYSLSGLSSASVAIATQAAMDGNNGGWAVLYGSSPVSASTLNLAIDEDQANDTERKHTTEQVGYIVFE